MLPPVDSVLEESQRKAMQDHPVPAFGRTRCYWSLLDADLRYLYLDPTCYVHMGEQAAAIIGSCLLDYVHPDEQHSARADLRNVLDSRTLHGSVTRVRYARLSRIRAILGCAAPDPFPDAHIVTEDEHYIACDVVINWVSDNVVLCFLHAIIDKGKADNDELHKTEWTNWCGTSAMTTDHASELYDRLQKLVSPSHGPPDRIFQILINQPARPILFSWPPEGYTAGEFGKLVHRMQIGGRGENQPRSEDSAKTSCTRRYKATQQVADDGTLKEVESIFIPHGAVIFACHKVMSSRRYSDPAHNGRSNVSDMYSYHSRPQHQSSQYHPNSNQPVVQGHYDEEIRRRASDGDYPAGGAVPDSPEYARSRGSTGYQRGPAEYAATQYGAQPGMRDMNYPQGASYGHQYNSPYPAQQRNGSYPPTQHPADSRHAHGRADEWGYSQPPPPGSQPPAQQWPTSSKPSSVGANGPGYDGQWMIAQGWNQGPVERAHNQQAGYSYQNQPYGTPQLPPPPQTHPVSPPPSYPQDVPITQPPPPPHPDPSQVQRSSPAQEETTPIPRVHAAPKRKRDAEAKKGSIDKDGLGGKDMISRERGQSAGAAASRVGGGPPAGVTHCSSCKSETSPEWRKGPSGKKDLCNACGLRYARSKQKKDGLTVTKRRRDKDIPLAPAPTPPSGPRHTTSAWPSAGAGGRETKRARSGTLTTVSGSPSPPRSEATSQPGHFPNAYDTQYDQNVYQNAYQNAYDEYGRVGNSVSSYGPPQGRGQAQAFAGQ
ncbi:GATA type zinc finger [Ceratobasidium sp. AG-Ba]|nr:GATA type zinc finger [Ceratobasidium sp. AG-Ba]